MHHQIAVALLDDVAEMNADPRLDAAVGRPAGVAFDHAVLRLDSAAHGVDHAAEFNESPVPSALDPRGRDARRSWDRSDRCGAREVAPRCDPRPRSRAGCSQQHRQPRLRRVSRFRSRSALAHGYPRRAIVHGYDFLSKDLDAKGGNRVRCRRERGRAAGLVIWAGALCARCEQARKHLICLPQLSNICCYGVQQEFQLRPASRAYSCSERRYYSTPRTFYFVCSLRVDQVKRKTAPGFIYDLIDLCLRDREFLFHRSALPAPCRKVTT
jgi:hypothetical protein